jgi:hypothetical protein
MNLPLVVFPANGALDLVVAWNRLAAVAIMMGIVVCNGGMEPHHHLMPSRTIAATLKWFYILCSISYPAHLRYSISYSPQQSQGRVEEQQQKNVVRTICD